jgi:hypothetical protein
MHIMFIICISYIICTIIAIYRKTTNRLFTIISRLFAFGRWRFVAIIVYHHTRLWQACFWWKNTNNATTKKIVFHPSKWCIIIRFYVRLFLIISRFSIFSQIENNWNNRGKKTSIYNWFSCLLVDDILAIIVK